MSELPDRPDDKEKDGDRRKELRLIREFLDVQRDELQIRREDLEARRQAAANAQQYGLSALGANERDRRSNPSFLAAQLKSRLTFAGFVVLVFAAILVGALWSNKPAGRT